MTGIFVPTMKKSLINNIIEDKTIPSPRKGRHESGVRKEGKQTKVTTWEH